MSVRMCVALCWARACVREQNCLSHHRNSDSLSLGFGLLFPASLLLCLLVEKGPGMVSPQVVMVGGSVYWYIHMGLTSREGRVV